MITCGYLWVTQYVRRDVRVYRDKEKGKEIKRERYRVEVIEIDRDRIKNCETGQYKKESDRHKEATYSNFL